jgi:hypothetical protein
MKVGDLVTVAPALGSAYLIIEQVIDRVGTDGEHLWFLYGVDLGVPLLMEERWIRVLQEL